MGKEYPLTPRPPIVESKQYKIEKMTLIPDSFETHRKTMSNVPAAKKAHASEVLADKLVTQSRFLQHVHSSYKINEKMTQNLLKT